MATIRKYKKKNGKIVYRAEIRIKGYKPITKTFEKLTSLNNWIQKTESQMHEGIYRETPNVMVNNKPLIYMKELIEFFKNNIAPIRYSYAIKYNVMYDWWIDKIGHIKIRELSAFNLTQCKNCLTKETIHKKTGNVIRSNNTINKYLMCLSSVLTYAVKELELIDTNPLSKITLMPKPRGRTRFLSLEEIDKLLNACKEHSDMVYLFVLISISTGGRYSEILKLRTENIDYQNNQVYFLDTKNKEHRGVFLSDEILQLLKKYLNDAQIDSGYIFLNKKHNKLYYVRQTLQNIIAQIQLKDFRIHDIRHTTASYIAMNGGSLLDIAEILGHKSLVMARRYSHLTQKHTASVLQKATSKMFQAF